MTLLFFIVSVLGIVVKPLIGRLIDTAGERFTLGLEALILICVCLLYAFAADIFPASIASCGLHLLRDRSVFASVSMARATYMRRNRAYLQRMFRRAFPSG
jgi:MFS family permease